MVRQSLFSLLLIFAVYGSFDYQSLGRTLEMKSQAAAQASTLALYLKYTSRCFQQLFWPVYHCASGLHPLHLYRNPDFRPGMQPWRPCLRCSKGAYPNEPSSPHGSLLGPLMGPRGP